MILTPAPMMVSAPTITSSLISAESSSSALAAICGVLSWQDAAAAQPRPGHEDGAVADLAQVADAGADHLAAVPNTVRWPMETGWVLVPTTLEFSSTAEWLSIDTVASWERTTVPWARTAPAPIQAVPSTAAEAAITGAGPSGQAWLKLIGPPSRVQGHVDEHQLGVVDVHVTSLGRLAEGVEGSKEFAPGQAVPRALGRITKVAVPPMVWEGALLSLNLIRTAERWYVQRDGEAFPIDAQLPSTAVLLIKGLESVRVAASAAAGGVPADGLSLLSPVTTPCRVVAQAVNYRSHAEDAGAGEDPPPVFFRKSSASISAPTGDVIRPAHVRLLDYELEVGLVMGRPLPIGAAVTDADLPSYVAAVVMCNDLSARDVQLEKGQFYESKSYPTFTPTGPRLVLLDADDFGRLAGLRLRLWVNGELRQDGTVADMITRPAAALSALARFQPLDPGDLVLTGTPGGTALQAPPAVIEKLGDLLPTPLKWRVFFSRQERNPAYLKAGDVVTASIATEDGTLDLGAQRLVVRDGDGARGI